MHTLLLAILLQPVPATFSEPKPSMPADAPVTLEELAGSQGERGPRTKLDEFLEWRDRVWGNKLPAADKPLPPDRSALIDELRAENDDLQRRLDRLADENKALAFKNSNHELLESEWNSELSAVREQIADLRHRAQPDPAPSPVSSPPVRSRPENPPAPAIVSDGATQPMDWDGLMPPVVGLVLFGVGAWLARRTWRAWRSMKPHEPVQPAAVPEPKPHGDPRDLVRWIDEPDNGPLVTA